MEGSAPRRENDSVNVISLRDERSLQSQPRNVISLHEDERTAQSQPATASTMSRDYQQRLTEVRSLLVRRLQMNEAFLSDMMKKDVLSREAKKDIDRLRINGNKEDAAGRLLDIVDSKSDVAFELLVWSLVNNEETDLATRLHSGLCQRYKQQLENEVATISMSKQHRDALRNSRAEVVRNLQLTELFLSYMTASGKFSSTMKSDIDVQKTREDKAGLFLTHLESCGPHAFDAFVTALLKTHQDHIAEYLLNAVEQQSRDSSAGRPNDQDGMDGCVAAAERGSTAGGCVAVGESGASRTSATTGRATAAVDVLTPGRHEAHGTACQIPAQVETATSQTTPPQASQFQHKPAFKEILEGNCTFLEDKLSVSYGLLPQLQDRNILTHQEISEIKSKRTEYKKVRKLVDLLIRGDDNKFRNFCDALRSTQQGFIADRLTSSAAK